MLRIVTGNRQEELLARLAATLGPAAAGDPLQPDYLVAERGMDRWLWQFLADTHGVAANLVFEPPAGFIWRMLRLYVPDTPADNRYDRGPLAWRIAGLLPQLLARPAFTAITRYLAGDDGRKRHQLAERIAALFNDYLVYRPEMVLGWQQGRRAGSHADEPWQMELWQAVVDACGDRHRASLLHEFLAAPRGQKPEGLPARVALFGIPALPPVYVQVLVALGGHIDIDLYVLNPCGEFWGDLVDPKHLRYLDDGSLDGDDLGNRLLASWGQPVRHFISELYGHEAELVDLHRTLPAPASLLQRLQHDIHALRATSAALDASDDSLCITSAFGALREVEIFHDWLLGRFQRDATLAPQQVLVLVPEIERYAAGIEAVFGAADGARHIPWSITDLPRRGQHPLAAACEQLLRLPDSRFGASEVLGLLETPAIARRFRLDEEDLARLRAALREAGLHGELDGATRATRGLPDDDTHTWQFALRRLFLGVAMTAQPAPVLGVLPEPAFAGKAAVALGRLQSFLNTLARWQERLRHAQVPDAWVASLHALLDDFFLAGDDGEQAVLDDVLKAAREFLDECNAGGCDEDLAPAVFRDHFLSRLASPASGGNLRSGGVVFAGMLPMRSLPWRIVAVLGLNADAFPRQQHAPGFDLLAAQPRAGDRARRLDDRHLFLEMLLSARESLYLSYTGRSLQDNSALEPSVVLRELLDQVVATHGGEAARAAIEAQLVVTHPLQPFSTRYFSGEDARLHSYDADWLLPSRRQAGATPASFCPQALPADTVVDIDLARLARFFANPAQGFLRERFDIRLHEEDDTFEDDEPFAIDGLAAHAAKTQLLEARLAGDAEQAVLARLQASGALPQAHFARHAWRVLATEIEPMAALLRERLAGATTLDIDLTLATQRGTRRLDGRLTSVTADGLYIYRTSSLQPRHLLPAWLQHLAMLAAAPDGVAPATWLITRGNAKKGLAVQVQRLGPVDDARALLAHLLDCFDAGREAPLPLLPACSLAWAGADDAGAARKAAWKAWEGDRFGGRPAEADDQAVRIVFGAHPPFADTPFADPRAADGFAGLAVSVCAPLLAALDSNSDAGDEDA